MVIITAVLIWIKRHVSVVNGRIIDITPAHKLLEKAFHYSFLSSVTLFVSVYVLLCNIVSHRTVFSASS